MAARLELTFHAPALMQGESIVVKSRFTFVNQRQNPFEVSINPNYPAVVGPTFRDAFQGDVNYLGEATVVGRIEQVDEYLDNSLYILTITHPDDDYFGVIENNTSFITHELTTVSGGGPSDPDAPQPVELEYTLGSAENACRDYSLHMQASRPGFIRIEFPTGHEVASMSIDSETSHQLTRPVASGTGTIRFYDTQSDVKAAATVTFAPPPILHINSVFVIGSPFGANATVDTENGLVRQYSLDNQSWQGSPQFFGVTEGNYTAYVRDNFGCTKTMDFEVLEEHVEGLTAPPFIRVPIHNSLRFADRTQNNFLGLLSGERTRCFYHEYLAGDRVRTQFKSSYKNNKAFLISEDESETEIPVIQKSSNINRISIYEGNYTEVDGRLAVYFTAGEIFNPDETFQGDHLLSGKLPLWYGRGVYLDIEGVGPTQIERLHHDQDSETTYAVTQMDSRGSEMGRKIKSIHSAHPYEVFEFEVEFVTPGTYQIRLEYDNGFYLSELIRIENELPDTYKSVQWFNARNNDIVYNTGIRQFRRLDVEKDFILAPRAEKETYSTDTSVELVNSKTFAVYPLVLRSMPMEVARGIQTALDNSDTILIDGASFVCEEPVTVEEDGLWFTVEAQLTLTDQTIKGQQNIVDVVDAQFLLVGEEGTAFLKI